VLRPFVMRGTLIGLAALVTLGAQSISITAPALGGTVSGFSGYLFKVALMSAPSVSRVCYTINGYPATNPGFGPLGAVGCSITPPFSYTWNTYWVGNGPASVGATAYDSLGNVVATSASVPFVVANNQPVPYIPVVSITTGTPLTSNWAGQVSITATLTGSGSDSVTYYFYIDGVFQQLATNTSGSATVNLDTTQFTNGPHVVAVSIIDNAVVAAPDDNGSPDAVAGEWSSQVAFANGATPMETRTNAHDIYLAPGATFNLGGMLVNTDGSLASSAIFDYATNPSISGATAATVNSSGLITAVANGAQQVTTMAEGCAANDLATNTVTQISSVTCAFTSASVGNNVVIKGGTGWTPGTYTIKSFFTSCGGGISSPCVSLTTTPTGGSAASGGHFATGPTRTSWVFVWPDNIMPHFGTDNRIHTSYDPAHSIYIHEMFSSSDNYNDQVYTAPCNTSLYGFTADINCSAFNALEFGVPYITLDTVTTQSAFQAGQDNALNKFVAGLTGYTKYLWCSADNLARQPNYVWGATRGPGSPIGSWSNSAIEYLFTDLNALSPLNPFLGCSMSDEFNMSSHPLQGPITPSNSGTNQSWLISVASNGSGTCTVAGSISQAQGPTNLDMAFNYFTITGSGVTNLDSVGGVSYHASAVTPSSFTFPCPGVAAGTYDASNHPGLTIDPLSQNYVATGNDTIQYDAFAVIQEQINLSTNPPAAISWTVAAGTNCAQTANALGNSSQSIRGINNISTYADLYQSHGSDTYLITRQAANSVPEANALGVGHWTRARYGCFSPDKPITNIMEGTPHNRGYQGYNIAVASFAGNTITTAAPHGLANILPGITRLSLSGQSSPADNGNYYVVSAPTPTTLTVAKAATSVACTGTCATSTTGTLTFQNGDTLSLNEVKTTALNDGYATFFGYNGSANDNVNRHRGQTFTLNVGGPQASYFNNTTFLYTSENLIHATRDDGSSSNIYNFFREIPAGSSTGGAANIIPHNSFIPGMSAFKRLNNYATPGSAYAQMIECAVVRCVGDRLYKVDASENGYMDHFYQSGSFTSKGNWKGFNLAYGLWSIFNDSSTSGQIFSNPHFESGLVVPMFHANNMAALMLSAMRKYLFTPATNPPDYGPLISCGARSQLLFCYNASDGPQTRTFSLTPYLQSNQKVLRYTSNWKGSIILTMLNPGTNTDTVTLNDAGDTVWYAFPANFSADFQQPTVSVRLADVPNAAKVVMRYAYDLYWLDANANTAFDCGTGTCAPPWDRNIGTVYYRLIYVDSNSKVLATSDVQTL